MVENIPPVYDENSTRTVLIVSTEPHSNKNIFQIPMKGKDEKEILSQTNFKELNKSKNDMQEEIFNFENNL